MNSRSCLIVFEELTYGLPYDSRLPQARSGIYQYISLGTHDVKFCPDLSLLIASSLNNTSIRNAMIEGVWKHAVWTGLQVGWPTSYNSNSGTAVSGIFR